MPSASANISAKFIAQIEIGETSVPRKSRPAEAISPTMVSISGRPAATSEPKASTRIAMVTGQEMNSDLSIASRFAWLKSDHIPEAPVRLTATRRAGGVGKLGLEAVGGVDHRVRIGGRAGPDHGRVAVGRDRDARPRRGDPTDGGIAPQHTLRTDHRLPETRAPSPRGPASGRRPGARSCRCRRSCDRSAGAPGRTASRSPASRRRRAPSPPAGRGCRDRRRSAPRR